MLVARTLLVACAVLTSLMKKPTVLELLVTFFATADERETCAMLMADRPMARQPLTAVGNAFRALTAFADGADRKAELGAGAVGGNDNLNESSDVQ